MLPSFSFSLFPSSTTSRQGFGRTDYSYRSTSVHNGSSTQLCMTCKIFTKEFCTKCRLPFCSSSCMIHSFDYHASCFKVPLHTSERSGIASVKVSTLRLNQLPEPPTRRETRNPRNRDNNDPKYRYQRRSEISLSQPRNRHESYRNENSLNTRNGDHASEKVNQKWDIEGRERKHKRSKKDKKTVDKINEGRFPNGDIEKNEDSSCLDFVLQEPINVRVTYSMSKREYYVIKQDNLCKIQEIHNTERKIFQLKPLLNYIYLWEFENYGRRVKVVKEVPLTVQYIDFGNEEELKVDRLFHLDKQWTKKPPLAFKIVLKPESSETLKYNEDIYIKAIDCDSWELCGIEETTLTSTTPNVSEDTNEHMAAGEETSDRETPSLDSTTAVEEVFNLHCHGTVLECSSIDEVVEKNIVVEQLAENEENAGTIIEDFAICEIQVAASENFSRKQSEAVAESELQGQNDIAENVQKDIVVMRATPIDICPTRKDNADESIEQCQHEQKEKFVPDVEDSITVVKTYGTQIKESVEKTSTENNKAVETSDGREIDRLLESEDSCASLTKDEITEDLLNLEMQIWQKSLKENKDVDESYEACEDDQTERKISEDIFSVSTESSTYLELEIEVPLHVTIVDCGETNIYKVICAEKKDSYKKLMKDLQVDGVAFEEFRSNCVIGKLYAVNRDSMVYRVRILCDSPYFFEFVDNCIDGDIFEPEELLILPEKFQQKDLVPFSVTLDVAEELSKEIDAVIELVEIVQPGLWNAVLVENESSDPNVKYCYADFEVRMPQLNVEHILTSIMKDDEGIFIPAEKWSETCLTGALVSYKMKKTLVDMNKRMMQLEIDYDYRPQVGELVIVDNGDTRFRGMVTREPSSLFPSYLVLAIDLAFVSSDCDRFIRMPEEFSVIPISSVICTLKCWESDEECLEVPTLNMKKHRVKLNLFDTDLDSCSGIMVPLEGEFLRFGVEFVKFSPKAADIMDYCRLKTGDRVTLLPMEVSPRCCIYSTDIDKENWRLEMLDLVNLNASKNCLEEDPQFGELVAVSHEGSLWRGIVLEKENEYFRVHLVDRGDLVNVLLESIQTLPEYFKLPYCTAVPVVLKDVRTREINTKVEKFLRNEYEFELVIEEDSKVTLKFLEDVLYELETSEFSSVNEYIDYLLRPDCLTCLNNGWDFEPKKVTIDELRTEKWHVGSVMNLYIAGVVKGCMAQNVSVLNEEGAGQNEFYELNLEERIQEYCSHFSESYTPAKNEICIAKPENGLWARALCLCHQAGKPSTLQFLDTGLIEDVWNKNVRRIVAEFTYYLISAQMMNVINVDDDGILLLVGTDHECRIISETEIEILDLVHKGDS